MSKGRALLVAAALVALIAIIGCSSPAPATQSPTATSKPTTTTTATASPTPTATAKPTASPTATAPASVIKLKFATYHANTYWAWEPSYMSFKRDVEAKSGGRVAIEMYPSGQLAPQNALFDTVRTGAADLAWVSDVYYPEALPMTMVWNLPPVWTNSAQGSVWFHDLFNEYFKAEHEKNNMHQLGFWVGPPYWLFTLKKTANKIEDLKGMTLRTFSQETTDMFNIFGVVPVNVPFSDVFDAMQKGTMDGATGLLASAESAKWHTIGKPGYLIDMGGLPSFASTVQMNKNSYDKLPADLKPIFDNAGWKFFGEIYSQENDRVEAGSIERMTKSSTTTAVIWTAAEKQRVKDKISPMWDKFAKAKDAAGMPGTKLVEAIKALAAKK